MNDSRFTNWPGLYGERIAIRGNFLAILAFAWAYVLLARWVEMQQSDATAHGKKGHILYLTAEANWAYERATKSPNELHVDLGNIDDNAAR